METPPVDERSLLHVLIRLRDVRREAVVNLADPWAFRQAMITVMAIDTACALEHGVETKTLARFDEDAELKAQEFLESIPEEWRAHGR